MLYLLAGGVYYSDMFVFQVGHLNKEDWEGGGGRRTRRTLPYVCAETANP